jgi:PAS domain S-box-containing protein
MSGNPRQPLELTDSVLRSAMQIAIDAVICTDADMNVTFFNDGAVHVFGYAAHEIIGQPLARLIPDRFRGSHAEHMMRFSESGAPARRMGERGAIAGLRKDGTEFPAEASIACLRASEGNVFTVVLRDITERQRYERENASLVRELLGAVAARDDMLSIVSHDLRNPVNAVKMLAAAILRAGEEHPLPAEVGDHADVMLQAARQMDALIQDLLDVSRLESGRLAVSPRVVAVDRLVSDATETLRPMATQAQLHLAADLPGSLPKADVDPDRIVQVLSNLISNAIKYTPAGGRVEVKAQADEDVVRVSVSDTGIGIADDELPRVFDRFWQSKRTNRSGAGLGLAIARGIVRAHGGRIWIESRVGAGTQVHFTIPRATRSLCADEPEDAGAS